MQKLQDICMYSLNLGRIHTITLKTDVIFVQKSELQLNDCRKNAIIRSTVYRI